MIHLYTDRSFLKESNRRFVFPLLFDIVYVPNDELIKKYTIVDSLEQSDIAILPLDISHLYKEKLHSFVDNFISEARKKNKIIWVYSANDFGLTVNFNYDLMYVFRLGGKDSKMNRNNLILSSFISDPYSARFEEGFQPLPKTEKPTIGFVGHATKAVSSLLLDYYVYSKHNLKRVFKLVYSDYFALYFAGAKRYDLLQKLSASDKLVTHFILRKKYRAGAKNELDRKRTTDEFFQNLHDNAYVFCFRGGGNFSVRFYEGLAMGRIPILINTDCRLPLSDIIDWKKHCLMIDYDKRSEMVERIVQFHNAISEDDFIEMQKNNRSLWLECLSRTSYFLKIHDIFNQKTGSHD